jgi:thioester reductase-like protein
MTMTYEQADAGDVLLTGATGFLGMELLVRYLERTDRTVLALVRASDAQEASARIDRVLELLFGSSDVHGGRVIALVGDVERDGLGLARADRELIGSRVSEIVHCAATVSFLAGANEARRINVHGTRELLELARGWARHGALRRFAHVSTAYVAGTHDGTFGEDDLDVGQRFRNAYERSKYEAEHLVRNYAAELPAVTILRPSIIVGESNTGWTPAFNVLYVPLRAFAQRRLRVLPATPSAPVDVVPADYVADAIIELTRHDEEGLSTYHLVAGERATTVGELIELSARQLRRRPPPIIPPRLYRSAFPLLVACSGSRSRAALRRLAPFLPYYTMRARYRRDRAAHRLDPVGLRPPPLDSYYERLLDYAAASSWGKRPLSRAHPTGHAYEHLAGARLWGG